MSLLKLLLRSIVSAFFFLATANASDIVNFRIEFSKISSPVLVITNGKSYAPCVRQIYIFRNSIEYGIMEGEAVRVGKGKIFFGRSMFESQIRLVKHSHKVIGTAISGS